METRLINVAIFLRHEMEGIVGAVGSKSNRILGVVAYFCKKFPMAIQFKHSIAGAELSARPY